MLKMEKEYIEKYGDIPDNEFDRINYILKGKKLSRYKKSVTEEIKRISKMKWKKISFTIFLLPKATPRPRSGKYAFYVKGAHDNRKYFEKYIEGKDIPLITTPAKFYCRAYFPTPESMNVVEKLCAELGFIYPLSKPDWDNVAKTYCDMIQDTLLDDDSIIIDGSLIKRYSIKPRIDIEIEYMENFDCQFNARKFENKNKRKDG